MRRHGGLHALHPLRGPAAAVFALRGASRGVALFLVSLSETAKTVRIIGISRNTITYISKLNAFGQLVTKTETQICLAYGFGATEERRSELAAEAVSNLFYGLPIQGYYTLYMDEIAEIVDYLGGVEVQITEDVAGLKPGWEVGKKVALGGAEMLTYLRTRDLNQSGSNELRFKRQQLFISSLFSAAKAKFKSDSTMPLTLFTRLSGRSTTNVSLESAVYLSTVALKSSFDSVQSVKGNLGTLFDRDALFVDEKALYELIIKNFYIQIS